MKEVKIDEAIRRDKELLAVVERVTQLLEEEIGPSASEITVEWSIHAPLDQRLLEVDISDGSVSTSLVTSESSLARIARHGYRISLTRLWGDLLQERSNKQMEKLNQTVFGRGLMVARP